MTIRLSTGLSNAVLGTASMRATLASAKLDIYTGAQPTTADDAPTGTLLATIDLGGAGINFDAPVGNVLSKAAAEVWSAVAIATGTAGWFRLSLLTDTGAVSTTEPRLDGAIAVSNSDMNISNTAITTGATQTVDSFSITLPLV